MTWQVKEPTYRIVELFGVATWVVTERHRQTRTEDIAAEYIV